MAGLLGIIETLTRLSLLICSPENVTTGFLVDTADIFKLDKRASLGLLIEDELGAANAEVEDALVLMVGDMSDILLLTSSYIIDIITYKYLCSITGGNY
jgi:hypothetical protein